jgi:hypothetical protein
MVATGAVSIFPGITGEPAVESGRFTMKQAAGGGSKASYLECHSSRIGESMGMLTVD